MNRPSSLAFVAWLSLACVGAGTDAATGVAAAQTIWCGPSITFQQPAAGQADTLTPSVAINRSFTAGIYNSFLESGYVNGSPAGTAWAFGRAAQHASLTFRPWATTVDNMPPDMVGRDMAVHLIGQNIYLDVRFTAWAMTSGSGSRFTYVRSTPGACVAPSLTAVPALPLWSSTLTVLALAALGGALSIRKRWQNQ